ncbi:SDR family NAD(P)-dependent oxidoreductase [Novosphingobium taihuense]|uniref:NAD(P)-dependent dehydrogenase (Short-subunit alcohol dehydrogenase family) n=1 Tax=Novosphingobium taihuense TaxID=260085 RepID=A0A7W7EX61_9SPHN|nr:SDR family NAD(P)-dependent oxidoreductase [Novosphingobium taihuense]MBB4615020.1 NAD(P)-dependent dehydrogenase (short-subunit alcohol dehydrogenase family) [Novosphingobium taihuense]TWH84539.1 NAD(P)-dependent dehydrogenase (short-subunit alcohol dehydrogenase family) [Novosphingobium taihuense]
MESDTIGRGRMSGRAALVTGAGSEGDEIGIGRAIALAFAREGARVACLDLEAAKAEATAAWIRNEGGEAIAIAGDVTSRKDCDTAVALAVEAFGGLDALVNNVGISVGMTVEQFDQALWQRVFDTNLLSAMLMARASAEALTASGRGSIVNISSIAGMVTMGSLAYGTSKAALHHLTCELALMLGRKGIRANTVAPGHLATPMVARLLPESMRESRRKVGPLGIEGDAWDVARAVLFLSSDEARFISGVELPVDGGVTMLGALAGMALVTDDS